MRFEPVALFLCFTIPLHVAALSKYLRDPSICGNPKCPHPEKFGFVPHVKYNYKYDVDVNTIFDGSGDKTSNMTISSHFFIYFKTPCEGILQILDADLIGDENDELAKTYRQLFNSEMTKNYLRFSFEDGRISQICPTDNEHVWVFNFKKGILSSLQNNMKRFDVDHRVYERDINGDCTTMYTFRQQNGTTLVISKKKLISTCANRHTFYSIIPLSNYVFQHRYHKWTPMNSSVGCHQDIDHGILTKVVCHEEHVYQPFHSQPDGVKSTASNRLVLISEDKSSVNDAGVHINLGLVKHRDDLLFDHRRPKRATHDDIYDCKVLLRRLCVLSTEEFQAELPEVFNQFIHVARDLSTPALSQLFKDSNSICPTARKHMKDALPFIRSRASTYLMTQVLLNREISEAKILDWLTIMAFFPSPDKETIDSVSNLLKQKSLDDQALLSVSSMVHSFCETRSNCESHSSVQEIVAILERHFNNTLVEVNETQRILGLKGVHNAGVMTPTMALSLMNCINNHDETVELRIHCINAHKRMACDTNLEPLIQVFTNQSINQEIRIASYLQIMRCPSYYTFKVVKKQLQVEEFNQVGSFVWSHLQNVAKSSMPNRMEFQAILQDEYLDEKFKRDFRKYSRHYETSFFLNSIGIGGIVENIVIFSEESFIPRQVTTNLTIHLFGEAVNICEVTLRLEGLDHHLEKWFKNTDLGDLFRSWMEKINPFKNEDGFKGLEIMRYIRELSNLLNDQINQIGYKHRILKDLKISLSMKTFGSDLKYYVIRGDEQFNTILESLNPLKLIKDFLSGQEVNIEKSIMLMDTSYVTPMCSGLPLKFNIVGTAAMFVNAMGFVKWDHATETQPDSLLEIEGKLSPNIGLNFEAYMYVDAFVEQTGVKFKGNVYTSTAFEGNLNAKGFKHIVVSFNLPMKKSQIFNAETQLMIVKGENIIFLEGVTGGKVENRLCSWSILDETIGLKMCLNYLLPDASLILQSPSFLFSGPLKLGLTLEKSDPTANKFLFEYRMENVLNKTLAVFSFETPGSQTKRGMKAILDLNTQSQNLTLSYQSNLTTLEAQGFYRNTPTEKLINFGLDINGKKHIDIHVGLEIEEERYGSTYKPKFLLAINNKQIALLSGSYKWVDKRGVSQCDIDLNLETTKFSTKMVGYVRKNDVSLSTRMKVDYVLMSGRLETVVVLVKLADKSSRLLTQFIGLLQLESSAYPQINMSATLKYNSAQGHKDCRIDLYTDPLEKDSRKRLYIQWAFQQLGPLLASESKLNTSLVIVKPTSEIDVNLGFCLQITPQSTTSDLIIQYAKGKTIEAVLELVLPHSNNFTFETKLMIVIPSTTEPFNILFKINEKIHRGEYDIEFFGTWFSGHQMTIKGVYLDRSTLSLTSHSVKLVARSELFSDLHLSSRFVMSADDCRADFMAEYLEVIYGVTVRHTTQGAGMYETFAELKYNNSVYTVSNYIDLIRRQTVLEFHLDRYRDVRIQLKGFTNETCLDSGIDVRWDANRDPTRKFVFLAITNAHGYFSYDGKFLIEYPEKVISVIGFTKYEDKTYKADLKLEWSSKDEIRLTVGAKHDLSKRGIAQLDAKLTTPFHNWQSTELNYSMRMHTNWLVSYGSISWLPNQNIKMELSYNYMFLENSTDLNLRFVINSTVAQINSMHAIFKYNQAEFSYKTDFSLKASPEHVIAIFSSGDIEHKEDDSSKYRISVDIETPFTLVKQSSMSSELNLHPENKLKASVHFTVNGKKYGTYIEGDMKYLNESKINLHLATPFEKYKQVSGKYSYSASRKHLVVELRSTTASLGTEILYIYNNIKDFNVKLHFHTSLVMTTNVLLVARLTSDMVDMRIGWSKVLVGVIGSSHYSSWYDVDYSLQLFTPVEGFHSCSAIAKFIFKGRNKVDFEASVNFANKKIGLRIQGMEDPEDDFAVPPTNVLDAKWSSNNTEDQPFSNITNLDFSVPPFGAIYWRGIMQLDSLLYPTVYAYTQINQDDTQYYLTTFFNFPFGQLKIYDEFKFDDYINIKNTLTVETTSDYIQEISGFFQISGEILESTRISSKLQLSKTSYNEEMKGKMDVNYYFEPEHENLPLEGKYQMVLNVVTPFELLPYCHTDIKLKAEKHSYACNMSVQLRNTSLLLDGTLEFDDTYLESNVGVLVNSSLFVLPKSRLIINKDFTDFDKKLDVELELPDGTGVGFVKYGVGAVWNNMGPNFRKYFGHILTPYEDIATLKGGIVINSNVEEDQFFMEIFLKYSESNEIKMTSSLKGNKLTLLAETSFEGFRDMNVSTTIHRIGKVNSLEATLKASKDYQIHCWATFAKDQPITVEIKMLRVPIREEVFGVVANIYNSLNGYDIDGLLTLFNNQVTLRGYYKAWDQIGKEINAVMTSTFVGYESLKMDGVMLSRGDDIYVCRMIANVDSSKLSLDNMQIDLDLNLGLEDSLGFLEWKVDCPFFQGHSSVKWINKFLEEMSFTMDAEFSFSEGTKDIYLDIYTWNVDKEFQEISMGSEIRYNKDKWRFNANGTVLALSMSDVKFLSHLLLPNKKEGIHTLSAKYKYLKEDNTYFTHLIKYNMENEDFFFQTLSEVDIGEAAAKGAVLVETGAYRFFDKFNGHSSNNSYKINTQLESTNMEHDLLIGLLYKKPYESHEISIDVFYPPERNIVKSHVDFVAINNMEGKINFTTPFQAFPNVDLHVIVITSSDMYKRYGRVQWKNQSAIFNYTHASVFGNILQSTDGSVLVDFPLHSRHKALLIYSYQSTEEKALGKSKLHYNDEFVMSGNYSRKTKVTSTTMDQVININVNNSFMPAGILYSRRMEHDTNKCCNSNTDFRRIEVYKLSNKTDFNLTGEYEVESSDRDKLRIIRGFIGQRDVKIESYHKGENLFISKTNFTLKRGFWMGFDFSKIFKEKDYGHHIELNISYPRRHFTLQSDYTWETDIFYAQLVVHPNMLKKAKYMGSELAWQSGPPNTELKSILFKLSHPSFHKNVTLLAVYDKNDSTIVDVDVSFEYTTDDKKKLMLAATLLKDKRYSKRWYQLITFGSHQATRLQYAAGAVGKLFNNIVQLNSSVDYKRSYSSAQQWNSYFILDAKNKFMRIKRKSSWEDTCLTVYLYRSNNEYLANASYLNNLTTSSGHESRVTGNFSFDIDKCKTYLSINFTPDSSEQLHMKGRLVDNGHALLSVWRTYDNIPLQDLSSHIRLNTSRILTAQLTWRPQIPQELLDLTHDLSEKTWAYLTDSAYFWTTYIKNEASEALADVWLDAKPILQDYIDDMRNVKDFLEDIKYFKKHFNESYNANEFYMQDIYNIYILMAEEMSFKDKMHSLPKIFSELSDIMGETSETIRQSIIWAVEMVQRIYFRIVDLAKDLMSGETLNKISTYIQEVALKYDKLIKDVHISFLQYMEQLWQETSDFISEHWLQLLNAVEPTFITFAHHIESLFWEARNKVLGFIFDGPAEIIKNSIFTNNTSLKDLDRIYKEVMQNDIMTSIKKYTQMFYDIVKEKYLSIVPFGYELNEIGTEVIGVAKELYKLPVVNFTIGATIEVYNQVVWMYDYFKIADKFQKAIPLMYRLIQDTSHTALENEMMNHKSKTLFIFDVENGIVKLEQKLPVPWHAFNQTPNFEEIPEYKLFTKVQTWFAPSNKTFWTYYNSLAPIFDTASWFPPFEGRSMISGMQHFVTFDKSRFDLRYPCSILLSKDYVDHTFALVLNYNKGKHSLILLSGKRVITYDPHDKKVLINKAGNLVSPLQIDDLYIIQDEGILQIISDHGFALKCNFDYDVCEFSLSGWYFGKVAGLLGTMDNEAKNDYLSSKGKVEADFKTFAMSWALGSCEANGIPTHKKPLNNNESCNSIYLGKGPFAACYPLVDPYYYNMMCRKSLPGIQNEVCTSAYSYVKACDEEYIPITMPNFCVRCSMLDGTQVEEGEIYDIKDDDVPRSSDVVFIMEAKECNQYMRERRLVQIFVSTLTKELGSVGLSHIRFAVVTFGGSGIFDEPRKIFVNNKFFTTEHFIPNYFESIPSGNGNSDIFSALKYASKLQFRPGVSKTFILIPCSDCDPSTMSLDYQTLQTVLIEKDIKLHILMNADFDLEKLRVSKVFYGLDSERAYTKSDFKYLKGDIELRRQIKLTKSMLGHCTPLAMATNGTIFTGKKIWK